jgi:hypothetical protein
MLAAALAGCGRVSFDELARDAASTADVLVDADLGAWSTRRQIRISNPTSELLVDVPVMLALDVTRVEYAVAAVDGRDLRFTARNGSLLDYEIDEWNPGARSIVWVRIPALPPGPDAETLTMHYGNPAAAAASSAATWTSDFAGVYHLANGVQDATANGRNGVASNTTYGVGAVGRAAQFNGSSTSYAVLAHAFGEVNTLSSWVRTDVALGATTYAAGVVRMIPGTNFNAEYLGALSTNWYLEVTDATGTSKTSSPALVAVGTWKHLAR